MKIKISLLVMALVIAALLSGSAAASDWQIIGGFNITNVTLDTYNNTIDRLNTVAETGVVGVNQLFTSSNLDKMDNIDRVPLLYLGVKRPINDSWDLNIRYEYIFGEVEQSYNAVEVNESGIEGPHEGSIAVDLHGLTFLADYNIDENWYLSGGLGYHWGTKTTDFEGAVYNALDVSPDSDLEAGKNDYDLSNGISVRAGVGYVRDFADNWDVNAKIDYLYIELEDEQSGNIYSRGFSYTIGLGYDF
ncbi:autotransporter outer membrane beta-barrel domain-containing protein [Halanaerobium sp. Z-7514]|uniref:Autotransporter outer membrane beta-barrel domain-containing protein n=1 Tax=Halanaerobium polyolivorans TaxID=2886943 RepID=A0AAW4WYV7_9FIRM|nr:autotransporter outer membrane beta-barrel domain-containing protein [Halanaerobium polyolivorans]MCC3144917.1 autotransporter outer membrane beta-barrel domain-containing protein [Halanaerobium polyolivorans]